MDPMNEDFIDHTITNLKIIGMIQINDKLSIRKGHLQLDKESNIQFLKRWINRDSRDYSIIYIKDVVRNLNILVNKIKLTNYFTKDEITWILNRILNEMEKVNIGLNNLKTTYIDDPAITVTIDNINTKLIEINNSIREIN